MRNAAIKDAGALIGNSVSVVNIPYREMMARREKGSVVGANRQEMESLRLRFSSHDVTGMLRVAIYRKLMKRLFAESKVLLLQPDSPFTEMHC